MKTETHFTQHLHENYLNKANSRKKPNTLEATS